ncbi:hypothetical protein [Marinospirillum alkaliphilum]|uniref:Uncharacterized protein n=1 Tax=Marinospirillum alkaliphilum DSM 21637 TaxID=1122209 RepID=A0A1K1ZA04_9GAMM|nr:hypothetical protein [Marinospirillum alkaliphilum]SFX70365.1 hypothetical protein SAMN02745752_02592 [Marinospirillum alkaliphilum DSM 21637]
MNLILLQRLSLWLLGLIGLAALAVPASASTGSGFNPLEHRMVMIQSRLMLTSEQESFFEGKELQQSFRVVAKNLLQAMEHSVCPLGEAQQQVRLNRIETFGIFMRLVALAENASFSPPDSLPANQYMGLRLLNACEEGQHQRVLEAALALTDANRS